jgi:D-tyrosyl-tRNA(Tyr) deacylase
MKALVQRVSRASVTIDGRETGRIGPGLLVLAGFRDGDTPADLVWMASKIAALRIFPDESGNMNLSLLDTNGAALVVSQFTLHADATRGRRPSFGGAAEPGLARKLYDSFVDRMRGTGVETSTGVFGAMMEVELVNDGPVTIMLESPSERSL